VEIDIQMRQHLESLFQSERDRLRNADQPDQIRPKEKVKRKALKGTARQLYLDRKATLSKAVGEVEKQRSFGKYKPEKEDE
tara:strand:- start:200 stop:442 length:243 start_codon:yes stop_codon:yes gene_type:complete